MVHVVADILVLTEHAVGAECVAHLLHERPAVGSVGLDYTGQLGGVPGEVGSHLLQLVGSEQRVKDVHAGVVQLAVCHVVAKRIGVEINSGSLRLSVSVRRLAGVLIVKYPGKLLLSRLRVLAGVRGGLGVRFGGGGLVYGLLCLIFGHVIGFAGIIADTGVSVIGVSVIGVNISFVTKQCFCFCV